jgi:hypothetical protein
MSKVRTMCVLPNSVASLGPLVIVTALLYLGQASSSQAHLLESAPEVIASIGWKVVEQSSAQNQTMSSGQSKNNFGKRTIGCIALYVL